MMDEEDGESLLPPGGAPGAEPAPAQQGDQPLEAVNLVSTLMKEPEGKAWLEEQGKKLVRRVKADNDSRQDWLKARADELKLYAGTMEMLADGGLSPHDPISTRTLLQLWSRGWDQICPAKGTLMQVQPNGPQDEEPAARREKYMNWQLRHRVPNWVMSHAQSYLAFIQSGSVFRERSYNPHLKITEFTHLTADDVIVSYTRQDLDPLMRSVPRVTRVLRYYRWEVEQLADAGLFDTSAAAAIYADDAPSVGEGTDEDSDFRTQGLKIDGQEEPDATLTNGDDKDLRPRRILRSQTWLKLPGQDRMKPVTFTVDRRTGIPLALTIREDEDPFDRARFEQEKQAWQLAAQNVAQQYQMQVQQHQTLASAGVPVGEPPPQPDPPPEPAPPRKRTLHNFVHYRLFPNPAGFYGIGVGYLLKNPNLLINKLELEFLESARHQNIQGGLLPQGAMDGKGPLELAMGKWHKTNLEPEQLASIRPFPVHPPADGLWKFIEKTRDDCGTLVADVDTMSGEAGPTNETKAAAEQRMGNATALVGIIVRLYLEPLKEEVKMLAHDNRAFMPDLEEFFLSQTTMDGPQAAGQQQVYRSDFKDEFDFTFTADQRLQTQPERVQAVSNVIMQLGQIPAVTNNPALAGPLYYTALQKLFRVMDMPEFEKALGQPPQPPAPPPPPTPMSQEDEIQGFFNDKDHPVLVDDDDEDHLTKIAVLKGSPYFKNMSPTGKQLLDRHEKAHVGQLYRKHALLHQAGAHHDVASGPGMGLRPGGPSIPPGNPSPAPAGPPAPAQPMPAAGVPS